MCASASLDQDGLFLDLPDEDRGIEADRRRSELGDLALGHFHLSRDGVFVHTTVDFRAATPDQLLGPEGREDHELKGADAGGTLDHNEPFDARSPVATRGTAGAEEKTTGM
jgi:hypothetical protein